MATPTAEASIDTAGHRVNDPQQERRPSTATPNFATLLATWWPLLVGLAAVLIPTWLRFYREVWDEPEFSHGPVVIAMALFLAWRQRATLLLREDPPRPVLPWLFVVPGAALYVLSVWIQSGFLETLAQIIVLIGAMIQVGGVRLAKAMAVPLLLLLLSAPLPGNVIASATNFLQQWVSTCAEQLVYMAGYPIARSGVMITIGSYQMLVAEACSGMNSLFSLTAVGLFYLFLVPRANRWQGVAIALAIVPFAIFANIVRVVMLVLITYHFGDEAGQGFLHELAGFVMFLSALLGLVALDAALGLASRKRGSAGPTPPLAQDHG